MAYITEDSLDTLNELQAEVRNAYGECIVGDNKIVYMAEPADYLTDAERRETLENLLDHVADVLDEYNEQLAEAEEGEV